jgi:hypothetical protein
MASGKGNRGGAARMGYCVDAAVDEVLPPVTDLDRRLVFDAFLLVENPEALPGKADPGSVLSSSSSPSSSSSYGFGIAVWPLMYVNSVSDVPPFPPRACS